MDVITHYQKSIEKSQNDPKRLLHCLDKLDRLSITIQLLEETGVGRTVNSLRKFDGEVGSAAKALISKWKNHVIQSQEGYSQNEEKEQETEQQKYSEPTNKSEEEDEERLVIDTSTNHKASEEHSSNHKHEKRDSEKDEKRKSSSSSHKKDRHDKKDHHSSSSSSSHKHKKSSKSHKKDKEKDEKKSSSDHKDSKSERKTEKDGSKSGHSSKDHHKSSSSSGSSSKRKNNTSEEARLPKILKTDGVDSSMGTSFEEALGMVSLPSTSKSSSSKSSKSSDNSSSTKKQKSDTLGLLSPNVKLAPLDPNITASIPTISNNYKPAPINPNVMDCIYPSEMKQRRILTDEEALSHGISSKTMRTKVYSGAKTGMKYQVPSLFNLCIRILQKNIDNLEYTGGVPFEILKPVLILASPQQLEIFEEYNPGIMEETDILWEIHCKKHCRGQRRQEMESWREMFFRFQDEQEHKLANLTKNIKKSQQEIALPVKKTQLAYVDSVVKAPRNVAKKQEIYGTKHKLISTPAARVATLQSIIPNAAKAGDTRLRVAAGVRDNAQASSSSKPKKAPLMAKMISMMKSRRR